MTVDPRADLAASLVRDAHACLLAGAADVICPAIVVAALQDLAEQTPIVDAQFLVHRLAVLVSSVGLARDLPLTPYDAG